MPKMIIDPKTLGPAADGSLQIQVTDKDGAVFIHFGTPVSWFGMAEDEALQFAKQILRHAGAKRVRITF